MPDNRDLNTDLNYSPTQQLFLESLRSTFGWGEYAMCKGDERFTAELATSRERKTRDADCRVICMGCPVRVNCLMHALEFPESSAFWAGFNKQQRDMLMHLRKKNKSDAILEVAIRDPNLWTDHREQRNGISS